MPTIHYPQTVVMVFKQPQYTFLVTEGKSASAFYSRVERDWVDTSPLVNYGDRKGLRWTEVNADAAEETTAIHTQDDEMEPDSRIK